MTPRLPSGYQHGTTRAYPLCKPACAACRAANTAAKAAKRREQLAADAAKALGEKAPHVEGLDLWGPAPAPLSVIRGMHRHRFLVRANRGVDVSAFLAAWSSRVKLHSAVRVQIDVDPYSFL